MSVTSRIKPLEISHTLDSTALAGHQETWGLTNPSQATWTPEAHYDRKVFAYVQQPCNAM